MNFCTKCQSIYTQPGSCNCYATMAPTIQPAPGVVPTIPYVPYVPTYPPYIPWWQTITVTGTDITTGTTPGFVIS